MAFLTLMDMIERFGAEEIVQVTNDRTDVPVSAEALTEAAEAVPDWTDYDEEEAAAALQVKGIVEEAIRDAESEVESFYQHLHLIPLAALPVVLEHRIADIARYRLYENNLKEVVQVRYDQAVEWLVRLSQGKVSIGLTADLEVTPRLGGAAYSAPGRVFTRGTLSAFTGTVTAETGGLRGL